MPCHGDLRPRRQPGIHEGGGVGGSFGPLTGARWRPSAVIGSGSISISTSSVSSSVASWVWVGAGMECPATTMKVGEERRCKVVLS